MNTQTLEEGKVITYRLRQSQYPTDPLRLWYGKIEDITRSVQCCWVTVLDPGYEELKECVFFDQIVEVLP